MKNPDHERAGLIRSELERVDHVDPVANPRSPKHLKMAASPVRFLRGSAQLFYTDIAHGVLVLPRSLVEEPPLTAVMGDCHISNFGFITEDGAHGDWVIFCPNDYDDACIGPAAWDLARFLVSLVLTTDHCRGVLTGEYASEPIRDPAAMSAPSGAEADRATTAFLDAYRRTCHACVRDRRQHLSALAGFPKRHVLAKPLRKARRRAAGGKDFVTKSSLGKDVEIFAGRPRFRQRPGRLAPLSSSRVQDLHDAFRPYVSDAILDVVQRTDAGTGSLDLERYYLLVGPESFSWADDLPLCHIVEVKQQRPASALFRFPDISPVNQLGPAHLTVECQRRMQRSPDLVLDDALWEGKHWLVRSRHHARVSLDPEDIALSDDAPGKRLTQYAVACGEALALAHARADRRSTRFERAMVGRLKSDSEELIAAARSYADIVKEDWGLLRHMLSGSRDKRV
jgi:uncharacterized protein (DUF2252 family)